MVERIGIDARAAFLDPSRGLGRVTASLAAALLELEGPRLVVFVPHDASVPSAWYTAGATIVRMHRPKRGAFLFDGIAWRLALMRHAVDVLHLPTWGVPAGLPCAVVATFYDATPYRFRSPPALWARQRARMGIRSVSRASLVHAISSSAALDLQRFSTTPADRIRVVHLGVGAPFSPSGVPARTDHLLFVGGGDPHKNLEMLLQMLQLTGSDPLPPLVVAGPAGNDRRLLRAVADAGLGGRVVLAGIRSDVELRDLYRGALATLVPSLNEGFGLPALEAMACGSPVVAARTGALPEVCGDAAVLLGTSDPRPWRDALLELLHRPERRRALAEAGLDRASGLTWRRTADGLLALYEEAARRSGC